MDIAHAGVLGEADEAADLQVLADGHDLLGHAELYMGYGDVRRTDLYAQYAMAAASQAMEDSGILGAVPPERLGVYFGSGIGGTGSCLKETEKLIQQGAHRVSPY